MCWLIHVPTWRRGACMERAVEEWGVIPGDSLAILARFSCLACVLPPLPANPLWDTWPWLSPWFFQQLPPVTPSDPVFWIPKGKQGGLCQGLGAPPAAPQLRARVRLHFNPSPCSGIPASCCQQSSRCLPNSEESVYKAHKSPFHLSHQKTPPQTMRKLDAAT